MILERKFQEFRPILSNQTGFASGSEDALELIVIVAFVNGAGDQELQQTVFDQVEHFWRNI